MKTVKINSLNDPIKESVFKDQKVYSVSLGNGVVKSFGSKVQARAFLAETSRFLTYKLHECNGLYIQVFEAYRLAWFYFDHDKPLKDPKARLYASEREIENEINNIRDGLNLIHKRGDWVNGNHFVFSHFTNLLNSMAGICNILQDLYKRRNIAAQVYTCSILNKKIGYCLQTINNYTLENENEFTGVENIDYTKILKIVS